MDEQQGGCNPLVGLVGCGALLALSVVAITVGTLLLFVMSMSL